MKIKKMGLYAWALVAAMVVSVLPINAVSVKAATTKVLDANVLEVAEYSEDTKSGEFTFVANNSKKVYIEAKEASVVAADGKEFSKVIKFAGGANQIKFTAGKDAKVTVYYQSGGSDERELGFYSVPAAAAELAGGAKTPTPLAKETAPSKDSPAAVATFTAPAEDEYYIASVSKGMWVYYVNVEEVSSTPVETPKTETKTEAKVETPIVPTGNTYTVQKGDTLCSIARRLFNAEAKWADLYNWNKATIKDPALIYIGQVLSINGETVSAPAETTKPAETTPAQTETKTETKPVAEPTLKFSYDAEKATDVPAELKGTVKSAEFFKKVNALQFADEAGEAAKYGKVTLPMTATTGKVTLELEVAPASKTAQSIVFKNSAGENVLIIANNIGNKTLPDGTYYFTDEIAADYTEESATATKSLGNIAAFPKNTWLKLTIEIDTAKSEAKVSVIGCPEASTYSEDYSTWTKLGEATYTFTNSKADIAGIEIQSTSNARFLGDISLTY